MKTEQEVREAITNGLTRIENIYTADGEYIRDITEEFMTQNEVQDLAVIIGKALGVVEC